VSELNIAEIEKHLIDADYRYDNVAFKIDTNGVKTVFLIWGGTHDSHAILNLRKHLAKAVIRLVVCDWNVFRHLYAKLHDWQDIT